MKSIRVKDSRCGTCRCFADHTCPRNDLYRKPETFVQADFASKCNIHVSLNPKK